MATVQLQGYKKIDTTGTAVPIIASTKEYTEVIFTFPLTNEFPICIGSTTVTATNASTDGAEFKPGAPAIKMDTVDLSETYINGHADDGVKWWGTYTG